MSEVEIENIKVAVVASIIIEYSLQNINAAHILKHRLQVVRNGVKGVESYFKNQDTEYQKEFLKGEYVMLFELLKTCIGLEEDTIEEINKTIKQNIDANNNNIPTQQK